MKTFHAPPLDQTIVDDYFKLSQLRTFGAASWLYGMSATFGLNPKELKQFQWNTDNTITITSKKRKLKPLHPQWLILFQLKEKQPSNIESCFEKIESKLINAIQTQKILLNLTDLHLAYQLRKKLYSRNTKDLQKQSPSCEALSAR